MEEKEEMACTTILVGKKASYDGSTMIARNDDGNLTEKKFVVVQRVEKEQTYQSVLSHVKVSLPANAMRYTAMPNAVEGEGIWAAHGVNKANVAMTATETITSNVRVLGADPLVVYQAEEEGKEEKIGGIGEEDIVSLVLPYIHSAREGVQRLGRLLEEYGTYEKNGIAFQDVNEIWWLETIGGHHWIAKRVPDEAYVVMPNQFGIDMFDLEDAFGEQKNHMCSLDLREFIQENDLDLALEKNSSCLKTRDAFGSHEDADHVYNTPRAWFIERYLNPHTKKWEGENADYTPTSDNLPWSMVPEKKITVEDVKYLLSSHYQGTPYDPYASYGDASQRGMYRSIGTNRTDCLSLIQIRPNRDVDFQILQWVAFASNPFNVLVPFYANVDVLPEYLSNTGKEVSTENFYWSSRMLAAMADASYKTSVFHIERYQLAVGARGHEIVKRYDILLKKEEKEENRRNLREKANQEMAEMLKEETQAVLKKVLHELSGKMKNAFARSDS